MAQPAANEKVIYLTTHSRAMVIYGQETVIGYSDFGRESGGYGRNDKERHIPNISLQSMN